MHDKPDSYHHGQLRRALLDAALELTVEKGINGLTLREVARKAGVSHAAPYHHFTDKSALIEALANECFERFAAAMRAAFEQTPGTAAEKMYAVGQCYVHFALEQRAAFTVMTRHELRTPAGRPANAPHAASMGAYQVLLDGITACQQEGFIRAGDPAPLALSAWATVHGLALLLLDDTSGTAFAQPVARGPRDEIIAQALLNLMLGLMPR